MPVPNRKIAFNGIDYSCKGWSVADRRKFLKLMEEIPGFAPEKQLDASIDFINEQAGIPKDELEAWDAVLFDQFIQEIIKANSAPPLGQSRP